MTALVCDTIVRVETAHMNEFVTPRKRKSAVQFSEPDSKKNTKENEKPQSASRRLIRRLSTRFNIFTPNKVTKSKYLNDNNVLSEKDDNEDAKLMPVTPSGPESKLCSSMTYFGAPFQTKNNPTNDRVSNSSDTSRQSYSSSQHLRIGIDLFNRNLRFGVEYMQAKGLVDSDEDLAEMFIKRKGFSKMRLFEFLTAKENRSVHKSFCNHLDLKFKTIPELLREYLKFSFITGEYGTMLEIVDVLGHAYIDQHSEGAVMGLNVSQVITIIQYLIAFNANEQKEKSSNRISRESFIEYLQTSLTEENKISRQLASCLYWEMCEAPLATTMDERFQNLDKIRKMLTDLPKDFNLIQYHRYIICHVDLNKVVLPVNGSEKPTFHERTVFLFNDSLVVTKKNWLYDSSSYRVKQIINLNQINCALVTRSASFTNPSVSPMRIVQIVNSSNTDTLLNFHSKVFEDLMSFYTSLENAIGIHRAVIEVYLEYEARSRS